MARTRINGTIDEAFAELRADYNVGRPTQFRPSPRPACLAR